MLRLFFCIVLAINLTACSTRQAGLLQKNIPKQGPDNLFIWNEEHPVCSDWFPEYCLVNAFAADSRFSITKDKLDWLSRSAWMPSRQLVKKYVLQSLNEFRQIINQQAFTWTQWHSYWLEQARMNPSVDLMLSASEAERLQMLLFDPPQALSPPDVEISQNRNQTTVELYQSYVDLVRQGSRASEEKPIIGIVTSGAADPYSSIAYYAEVFEQAGAKTVWIPMNTSFYKAQKTKTETSNCRVEDFVLKDYPLLQLKQQSVKDYQEKQNFYCQNPSVVESILRSINGLFFMGSDEKRLWQTFEADKKSDFPLSPIIFERFDKGHLIVGGKKESLVPFSMLVSSLPMKPVGVTRADYASLSSLLKSSQAGWTYAEEDCGQIMPCETSTKNTTSPILLTTSIFHRHRFTQLLKALQDQNGRLGLGLTSETALIMSSARFETIQFRVVGKGGLLIVNPKQADYDTNKKNFVVEDIELNFINADTKGKFQKSAGVLGFGLLNSTLENSFALMDPFILLDFNEVFPLKASVFEMIKRDDIQWEYQNNEWELELLKGENYWVQGDNQLQEKNDKDDFTSSSFSGLEMSLTFPLPQVNHVLKEKTDEK
ncbi:MAG: hypothetical protein AAGB12_04405 [Pseudomonadota bacterium]